MQRITLVTPVLNGARFFAETIGSIRAQRYPNLEYIVRDGGSTDGSVEIANQARDVVSSLAVERDGGMYSALAKGFAEASGEILGWINSDDVLMPWCLSVVSRYFSEFPECDWITGVPTMMDDKGHVVWTAAVAPRYNRRWIARGWYSARGLGGIQQESTFFRRRLYERVGGIRTEFRLAGDFDLWRRFAMHSKLTQVGTIIASFRLHGSNLSGDLEAYLREAQAPRIRFGTFLGSLYSFLAFCATRVRRERRFKDIALPGSIGTRSLL